MSRNAAISDPPSNPPTSRTRTASTEERTPSESRIAAQETAATETSRDHESAEAAAPSVRRGGGWLVFLLLVSAVPGIGWYYRQVWWPRVATLFVAKAPEGKPPMRPVPVGTAKARQQDMSLYLNGLGTVTPLKTVTVRSRVEGELVNIAFTEGQMVQEGDLLAEIDQRPFELQRDQAAGQLARDEAMLSAARFSLNRYEQLLKDKIIPVQQVQDQTAVVQQLEGSVKTDKAMIANAELQITYCRITSPVSGRIGLRLVDIGNIVRANDPSGLAVVNQIRPITIVFTISQDDIPRVQKRIHEGKELRVEAFDREMTTRLAVGKLLAADNQVDSATGTLRLKALVEDGADELFPNQFVNTRLLVSELPLATTVPSTAVQRGPKGTFVYVIDADDKAEVRMVDVGDSEAGDTIIEQGLNVGETVVTAGLDKLQPGAKVATRSPEGKGGRGEVNSKGQTQPASSGTEAPKTP